MTRSTRNSTSGALVSLPNRLLRKRKGAPPVEEEMTKGNAVGDTGRKLVRGRINKPPARPHKRMRATPAEPEGSDGDNVGEESGFRKTVDPAADLEEVKPPAANVRTRKSPRKNLRRGSTVGESKEAAGPPRPRAVSQVYKRRSQAAAPKEKEMAPGGGRDREIEGLSSEDEEGGGARLSGSHDTIKLREKQPAPRRSTRFSLRAAPVDPEKEIPRAGRRQGSPEEVHEEVMNSALTVAIEPPDMPERSEVETLDPGEDSLGPGDEEYVEEVTEAQSTDSDAGDEAINVAGSRREVEEDRGGVARGEVSLVDDFKDKLEKSSEVFQAFREQLKAVMNTADKLMGFGTALQFGYSPTLHKIILKLSEDEHPDNDALEELADLASRINTIVSETRDARRDVGSLLEHLSIGIMSGNRSVKEIETMLGQKGFGEKTSHDGINWNRINKNLEARENEILISEKPKTAPPLTPRRSARSNPSRYRTQGAPLTPEAGPPLPPPAIALPPPLDSMSGMESLDSNPPVIGDDAPVEVVRIESFGSRPSNNPRRSNRRLENEDGGPSQAREDRAWSSPELRALFRRIVQVKKAQPGGVIVLDPHSGYSRTKEEILTKAKEIKEDMRRSGKAGSLKPAWDSI